MDNAKSSTFTIEVPELCVVALIGGTSSGKSSFAAKHFLPTEVLSSDFFRGMITDDENDQSISADAFELLYYAANKRLNHKKHLALYYIIAVAYAFAALESYNAAALFFQ